MANIDKRLMEFLAKFPKGHVDITSESFIGDLRQRFARSSFVEEYKNKIASAPNADTKKYIRSALEDMLKEGERTGDLMTVISVFEILTDHDYCREHDIAPIEISQRNLIIAKILFMHKRADLAEAIIPGISEGHEPTVLH